MSYSLKTKSHGLVDNCGFLGPMVDIVRVGEYEISLEEFVTFSMYVLGGGILGWNGPIPDCVQKTIKAIKKNK